VAADDFKTLRFLYTAVAHRYRFTSAAVIRDAAISPDFQSVVEARLLNLGSIFGFEDFLSGWFRGAPMEKIKRGNVEDFLAYGFYCKRVDELTPEVIKPSNPCAFPLSP
jgi:hypothetical protein